MAVQAYDMFKCCVLEPMSYVNASGSWKETQVTNHWQGFGEEEDQEEDFKKSLDPVGKSSQAENQKELIRQLREQRKFCSGEDTEEGKAATAGRQKEAKARAKQRRRETDVDTEEEDKNQ